MSEKNLARVIEFEGQSVPAVFFRGRWCWPATSVGKAVGYKEGRIVVDKIRGDWREEFVEGKDYEVLNQSDLKAFREVSSDSLETSKFAGRMLILTESGLDLALVLAKTAKGRRLRRMLVDYILPQLRAEGTATLPGASIHLDEQALARVVTSIVPQVVAAVIPEVLKALPTSAPDPRVAEMQERLAKLEARLASGVIGPVAALDHIVAPLRVLCSTSPGELHKRIHARFSKKLRNDLNFNMRGSVWANLPHESLADAILLIERYRPEIAAELAEAARVRAARDRKQPDLPFSSN
jgi:prophage antirepressor-like protein